MSARRAKARGRVKRRPAARAKSRRPARAKKRPARARPRRKPVARTKQRAVRTKRRPARTKKRPTGPRLAVVRPRTKRPAAPPPPAFPQAEGASAKHRTLFELVRARAALMGAIQGLGAAAADRPMAKGKWSVRETVLHLVARDQARLREMEAALRGVRVSWAAAREEDWPRINAETLAPLAGLPWEEAVRLLQNTRQRLMELLESVPEEPADVWAPEHPFGEMLSGLPPHDRHHAEQLKRWREEAASRS